MHTETIRIRKLPDWNLEYTLGYNFRLDDKMRYDFENKRRPIINSLLDVDFYKFTMGNLIHDLYNNVPVKFTFINRTKGIKLANHIDEDELRRELDHVQSLRFNKTELHYLRGTTEYITDRSKRTFDDSYIEFLRNLKLPPYNLKKVDDNYKLEFPGKWGEVTYWETIALSIINELYFRSFMEKLSEFQRDCVYATGVKRLSEKIDALKKRPDITFCDFGTRRRFNFEWQDYIVKTLAEELPKQFTGTSNTYLAMKHNLLPIGTSAHEMYMGLSGIMHDSDDEIRSSHNKILQDWWKKYGYGLSIALTDNYGTDFFFKDMTPQQAREWKGLRQDSGDPFEFTDKVIDFYERCDVNPRDKLIVYSDGLDVDTIVKIQDYTDKIKKTYGWGTNLTNDLGFKAMSIIIKLTESNGYGTVKLSDNIAKALGTKSDIEHFKEIFDYSGGVFKECRY